MTDTKDQFVSVAQAAKWSGVKPRTIRTWANRGQIRVRRVNSRVLVHYFDVRDRPRRLDKSPDRGLE